MGRESKLRPPPFAVRTRVLTRYQFVRELWAQAPRVLVDPMLVEHADAWRASEAAQELLDELLEPARRRPRTQLLAPGPKAIAKLAATKWAFASVDLRYWQAKPTGISEVVAALASTLEPGRTLVLHAPATLDLDGFIDLLDTHFEPAPGEARMFAIAKWGGAAVVDCGSVDGSDDEREFGITFDNTLGDETEFEEYVAVLTPGRQHRPEAMTLVELPMAASTPSGVGPEHAGHAEQAKPPKPVEQAKPSKPVAVAKQPSPEVSETAIKRNEQLRRQNQLLTSARQHALEQLDQVNARNRELGRQIEELQRQMARFSAEARTEPQLTSAEDLPRGSVDSLRARLQTALWQIEQLEAEVQGLRERPPSELEAALATATAKLARAAD